MLNVILTSPTVKECEEVMGEIISNKQEQWEIWLNRASRESLQALLTKINHECPVGKLHIGHIPLDDHCVSKLCDVLNNTKSIEYLCLKSSPLPPNSLEKIMKALHYNTTLKKLKIWYDSTITDEDIPHMCEMLSINTTLKKLSLISSHNITNDGKQELLKVQEINKIVRFQVVSDHLF